MNDHFLLALHQAGPGGLGLQNIKKVVTLVGPGGPTTYYSNSCFSKVIDWVNSNANGSMRLRGADSDGLGSGHMMISLRKRY